MMFWYGDAHWYFWQAALMWVGMIVFWGAVIWVIYSVFTRAGGRGGDHLGGGGSARRILDERFARGEIDAEEYRHRRDTLESGSQRPMSDAASRT